MNKQDKQSAGRGLYVVGGLLTTLYLIAFCSYCTIRWGDVNAMQPNNIGDFLAGAFSPLAFAWLVLGFIQQGIELRQNSAALSLQAEELRSAAEHAGAMVELQRKEFDLRIQELEDARRKAEHAAASAKKKEEEEIVKRMQPRFGIGLAQRNRQERELVNGTLKNYGPGCTNVKIYMEPIHGVLSLLGTPEFETFPSQIEHPIVFRCESAEPRTQPLTIKYTDAGGNERQMNFVVSVVDDGLSIYPERD